MNDLDQEILQFGTEIFKLIGDNQPSTFNKGNLHNKMMEWSFNKPEFKYNLFRLVDVLPALKSNKAVAKHVDEYLSDSAKEISSTMSAGFKLANYVPSFLTAAAVKQSVNQMASMFIAGEKPVDAIPAIKQIYQDGLSFTVDLLGEFAVSEKESLDYQKRYIDALVTISEQVKDLEPNWSYFNEHPGAQSKVNISIKLSALYSQTSVLNFAKSVDVLSGRLAEILRKARELNVGIYLDAEDTGCNPIIFATFKNVFSSDEFKDFPLPGIVLQAYARDCEEVLGDFLNFAKTTGNRIAVRLVKGAYWDHETVNAEKNHWPHPLYVDKAETDENYEKLSIVLLDNLDLCYPAFGSHNIRSLSHACCYAQKKGIRKNEFELQMLYGMATPIAMAFRSQEYFVRLYVPLGKLIPGMGYLVRRLLENTSNESFLRHTFFDETEKQDLLKNPAYQEAK